jgi:hypothetical protein
MMKNKNYLSDEEFQEFLDSIGGLKSGYFTDRIVESRGAFCVSNGWLGIIKDMITDLISLGWDKEFCDCKEKFGGLRFYINSGSDEIFKRISEAEKLCYTVCEKCGEPGELRTDIGWVLTLCDEHYEKIQ